jgi:DNA-binding IclR family transcriptional regulator
MVKSRTTRKAAPYNAPALEKGLDILELLASAANPMNLSEISQGVGRSKSEIFRMLHVLERRHYLERVPGADHYTLTNRLFLLGMERPALKGLLEIALPMMHKLSDDTQQSCHLVAPSDQFMVVIARIEPPGDLGLVVRIGHRRPLLEATSGLVLVAFQPEPVRDRWIREYATSAQIKERAKLMQKVESIQSQGYAAIPSLVVPGITDMSAPVLRGSMAVAALAIPYMQRFGVTVTQQEAIKILCGVAAKLSSKLR